jgi:hypothetical protein
MTTSQSKAGVLLIAKDSGDTVVYDLVKKLFVYIINNLDLVADYFFVTIT